MFALCTRVQNALLQNRIAYPVRCSSKRPRQPNQCDCPCGRGEDRGQNQNQCQNNGDDCPNCKQRVNNHFASKYRHLIQMLKAEEEFQYSKGNARPKQPEKDAKKPKKERLPWRWLRRKNKQKQIMQKRKPIAGKNVMFVGGFGEVGMVASSELMRKGPKNLLILAKEERPKAIKELKRLNKKTKVHFIEYDVTIPIDKTEKMIRKIFDKFKTIDLLINGAGLLDDYRIEETIAVNFTGTVNTTTAIMSHWDTRMGGPGGVVANVCSASGFNPIHQLPVYSASKAAAISFTISLAKLACITGVKAYSINPGITRIPENSNCNSWLDVEPCVGELLLIHPAQTKKQTGYNIVRAIEEDRNGVIWRLDQGRLEAVKWTGHTLWDAGI